MLCAATVGPAAADAATRYAEPAGNGPAATCPLANPCDLSTAVESPSVADGDEVVVLPGRHELPDADDPADGFSPNNPLYIARAIQLHGSPGEPPPTIVARPGVGSVYVDEPGAIVSDVAIEGGLGLATGVAERVTVHQTDQGHSTCFFDKYSLADEPPPLIRDSVCWSESLDPGSSSGSGVLVSLRPVEPRSLAARLVNVTAIGGAFGVAVAAGDGSDATVEAQNVVAIATDGADVGTGTGGGGVAASLSLVNSNYRTAEADGPGAVVTPAGTGTNQTAMPILASPSTGDVRQVIGSPTIDAGAPNPLLGTFDFEREPRVQGTAPDIGADEGAIPIPLRISAAGRRALRDLRIRARCEIPRCGLAIEGVIKAKGAKAKRPQARRRAGQRFKLKPRQLELGAGEQRKVKLKLKSRARKRLQRRLDAGAKARAAIDVDTGDAGFSERVKIAIKRR
jgi:hypothetical protein